MPIGPLTQQQSWVRGRKAFLPSPSLGIITYVRDCYVRDCYVRDCYVRDCYVRDYYIRDCYVWECYVRDCYLRDKHVVPIALPLWLCVMSPKMAKESPKSFPNVNTRQILKIFNKYHRHFVMYATIQQGNTN
jgi:hypothetical protein